MNLRTISVVISREYETRVKKKSFLVTTFLVPVLFAALCCIPALLVLFNKDEAKEIAVVDESGIVMPVLESNSEISYVDCSSIGLDSLKAGFEESSYSAILYISAIDEDKSVSVSTYSTKPVGLSVTSGIEDKVNSAVRDYRIEQYNIEGLKQILDEVWPDIDIKNYTIGEDGEDRISSSEVYMFISLGLGVIIFMFVTMFSSSVMQSVVEEKQSKVVEVLLSSVDSVDLMFGKIIGVALVALTQFLLWIVLTTVIVSSVLGVVGKDKLTGATPTELVQQISPDGLPADAAAALGTAAVPQEPTEMQEILQTIGNIDVSGILLAFFGFFIFGYLLYASMFAAIGSAVENAEESNKLQVPLTVPLMLAYFLALYSWNAPDSAMAVWGSMIPFTSPIVMLARIPFGVPAWQIWLSFGILVATFIVFGWLSAKIYRVGILTSGKTANWKDLWKWLKQK
ncbi:MAG: ABC transporter permease [Bacteroidales bacterium]|nr:ABC transporter permease [Candidatus Hennigimonas equi]